MKIKQKSTIRARRQKGTQPWNQRILSIFSHCIGIHARTLHVIDFFYMLNLDQISSPVSLQLIRMIIRKHVMLICVNGQKFNV